MKLIKCKVQVQIMRMVYLMGFHIIHADADSGGHEFYMGCMAAWACISVL